MSATNISRRSAIKLGAGAMALAAGATVMPTVNSSTAHAGESGEAVFSAPGTYTGEGPGRNGTVTVTMTASENAIESIDISSSETPLIGVYAMDKLKDEVLAYQSLDFNTVSGATFSSNAFRLAITDCVEQAGYDIAKFYDEIELEPTDYDTAADVLIVGAGGSGLAAALTAAQAGASVIVLEKGSLFGGNTNVAMSGINVVDSQALTDAGGSETLEEFIEMQTNELADPELVEAFAAATGPAADWIADMGVQFVIAGRDQYQLSAEEPSSYTGQTINRTLVSKLGEQSNVQMYLNTPVTSLVVDDSGTVIGVTATGDAGQELTFTADSVILATGGYGRNHEFVVECRPDYANTITDEVAPTTGDGLFMAQDIGANAVDLDQILLYDRINPIYGQFGPVDYSGNGWTVGGQTVGIYVNKQAVRFGAEVFSEEYLILEQEDGIVYHILPASHEDETIVNMLATGCGWQADTPEDLAEAIGLDPTTLAKTIETWNEGAVDGVDNEFGRTDAAIMPLEGTLDSVSFGQGVHYCMGGIAFDTSCRVLDTNGDIIPGLYACGECTGGLHGTTRVDGSGVGEAFAFGHLVGQVAAEAALA